MSMKFLILAGGSGTRLWPRSRELFPKQFIAFQNEDMNYKHLKNINTKIEQKANNKDQIIFNIYDDFYEKRFKKLSHI